MKEALRNFEAFYLPGGGDALFYKSVTPVNIFRLIFNFYFQANYPLLDDKSYFAPGNYQYKFFDVTDKAKY